MIFLVDEILIGIISVPFLVMILVPTLVAIAYFVYFLVLTLRYRTKLGVQDIQNLFAEESISVPDYEPSVMAYLVNYQKIGRREICSTLFDLVGRGVISITLKEGFVSDDNSKYILNLNEEKANNLQEFEALLIKYIFGTSKSVKSENLHNKIYKKNLDEDFYGDFFKVNTSEG